jgi:hypothetical protein
MLDGIGSRPAVPFYVLCQGATKEKKMKATYIWQMATNWGRYLSLFFFNFEILLWRFCAFLNKGSSKTPQKTFWGKSMSKAFGRKS